MIIDEYDKTIGLTRDEILDTLGFQVPPFCYEFILDSGCRTRVVVLDHEGQDPEEKVIAVELALMRQPKLAENENEIERIVMVRAWLLEVLLHGKTSGFAFKGIAKVLNPAHKSRGVDVMQKGYEVFDEGSSWMVRRAKPATSSDDESDYEECLIGKDRAATEEDAVTVAIAQNSWA